MESNIVIDLTNDSDAENPVTSTDVSQNSSQKKQRKIRKSKHKIKMISDFFRDRASGHHSRPRFQLAALANIATNGQSVILGNPDTQHFGTTLIDRGWACGYRNCQMLISGLISDSGRVNVNSRFPEDRTVPSVRQLQEMLELAWRDGFDTDGAEQLEHRVVGTKKWIGTTEIYCILAHIGVRSSIVDFHCPTASDGTHPALFSWITEYFTDGQPNTTCSSTLLGRSQSPESGAANNVRFVAKQPLYLQHQGHSRTVVGVEMSEIGTNLLVFDPDVDPGSGDRLSLFRFMLRSTRGVGQYQVLFIDGSENSTNEALSRVIASRRIP
ncbi:hypothetical protein LPJ73_002743 [Coemansia sp. RSA 2703]|nr:hypothetical protein LPJ73_002743 [Coemansia sp. RSA 2703]KAJ2376913.1 hypothetical protein IW150_001696 [Coemansia sp. RSA 2607]